MWKLLIEFYVIHNNQTSFKTKTKDKIPTMIPKGSLSEVKYKKKVCFVKNIKEKKRQKTATNLVCLLSLQAGDCFVNTEIRNVTKRQACHHQLRPEPAPLTNTAARLLGRLLTRRLLPGWSKFTPGKERTLQFLFTLYSSVWMRKLRRSIIISAARSPSAESSHLWFASCCGSNGFQSFNGGKVCCRRLQLQKLLAVFGHEWY